jgi:ketosteroid isomerase-like protein
MSRENVEMIRAAHEDWQRDESWTELIDPEIEWDYSAFPGLDIPVRGRGREDYLRLMDRYVRAWSDYDMAPKELIDAGDDVVVVLHETIRIRGTEGFVERDSALVWTIRNGSAVRVRAYPTKREALEATGLSE